MAASVASAFISGAGRGIAWNVQSRRSLEERAQLVDWARARQVARLIINRNSAGQLDQARKAKLETDYRAIIEQVSPQMLAYLGPGSTPTFRFEAFAHVVDRLNWVDANIENFRTIFEPVEVIVQERLAGRLSQPINQQVSSLFLGVMLGYLSGRVLGQYDPSLLGKEAITAGKLFFVQPNLEAAQRELQIPRDQFLTWIVFHELTHSWQFEAHPWLRDFMNMQVRRLVTTATGRLVDTDATQLLRMAMRGDLSFRQPRKMVTAMMTADQLQIFDRLQAVMSLVEGFSDHVMDTLGPEMLPAYDDISHKFKARQGRRTPAENLFMRVTGLEMKMEQYRVGELFVNSIVRQRGIQFMNQVWDAAANLPTLDEVYEPAKWITRMSA